MGGEIGAESAGKLHEKCKMQPQRQLLGKPSTNAAAAAAGHTHKTGKAAPRDNSWQTAFSVCSTSDLSPRSPLALRF